MMQICKQVGLVLLACMPFISQAQRTWWAGANIEIAETNGLTGWAYGAGGGIAGNHFYAGGFVMQTTTLLEGETTGNSYAVSLQYGGLMAAYHRTAIGALEVTGGLRLGVGRATRSWKGASITPDRDAIYLAMPFLGIETAIGSSVKLSLCSGFRFFGGFDRIAPWRNRDLCALANSLGIRVNFGKK